MMVTSPESNTSRSLSPTIWTMAENSSRAAMPSWMLSIRVSAPAFCASSALRSASSSSSRARARMPASAAAACAASAESRSWSSRSNRPSGPSMSA